MPIREECGNTLGIRYPDVPVDQWETAACIQTHDDGPGTERMIHDSGDGWKWMLLNGFTPEAPLIVPAADLKALREALAVAQAAVDWTYNGMEEADKPPVIARLGQIIAEIDRNRPLGPDGKHGNLHTPTCGCDDR
ncbi:hypothetical protein SEA_KOZIE_82 [Microbacterium phage Kozie]|uniref:Uncharacterized protein n=1 Tax=Microbacterium phage Kozie TaxID=2885981 RepID=A0AAE9C2V0_9CAUD|nr:hypothetical protein QC998_gp82 [Microbacterium phage Kozie]UDL16278.1 hypothetical protein SEA_KOZIE_82 [Microbacterium phage Kozie]